MIQMTKNEFIRAMKFMHGFYSNSLYTSGYAYSYLSNRISENSIKKFGLGYSPNKYSLVESLHNSMHLSEKDILSLGVFQKSEKSIFDRFHNRIIFPVCSPTGDTLGFVGRTSHTDHAFKYLNTSDSVFFQKSLNLFGINLAVDSILSKDFVFLVEGLFDVISMHEAGFSNTIASLGTTVTEDQLYSILFFTKNLVIVFDGDSAGQAGAMATKSKALNLGFNVKSICLPMRDDPDSLYHSLGREPFRTLISNYL